jgi:hypothetical protein
MPNPHLPAETLDHIIDNLCDTQDALRNCCLVSKSWVPRTRKYLFAHIEFPTKASLQSWKKTFPDPLSSPAGYAKALSISCPEVVTVGNWIRSFCRVEHLYVNDYVLGRGFSKSRTSLIPFHGFSSVIKSLCAVITIPRLPLSQIFDLIFSFPLLEDLAVTIYSRVSAENEEGEMLAAAQPQTPPPLTGSLELEFSLKGWMKPFTRQLLSLLGGVHFRKFTSKCSSGEELLLATELVEACSRTLEFLDITLDFRCTPSWHLHPH